MESLPSRARETAADLSRLVKLEVALAAEEAKGRIAKKAGAAGLGAVAAMLLAFGFLMGLFASAQALAIVLPEWAAFAVVAGATVVLGVLAGLLSRAGLRSGPVLPERSKERIKGDVRWLREQTS